MRALSWRKAAAVIDEVAGPNSPRPVSLTTPGGRARGLATRLLEVIADALNRERSSYDAHADRGRIDLLHPVAVIDFETTGLDPKRDKITEVAVIRCDRHLREIALDHVRVDPGSVAPADCREFIRTNTAWGRCNDPVAWDGLNIASALERVWPLIEGAGLIAHHVPFDLAFLIEHSRGAAPDLHKWVSSNKCQRRCVCTRQMATPLLVRGLSTAEDGYPSRSLAAVARALGVPLEHHHDPICDARATLEVARLILSGEV